MYHSSKAGYFEAAVWVEEMSSLGNSRHCCRNNDRETGNQSLGGSGRFVSIDREVTLRVSTPLYLLLWDLDWCSSGSEIVCLTLPEHISKPSIVSTIKPLAINVLLSSEELATAADPLSA